MNDPRNQTTDQPLVAMHKVSAFPMSEGVQSLEDSMDRLWHGGWEPFHVHETIRGGSAMFLVFSRRRECQEQSDA